MRITFDFNQTIKNPDESEMSAAALEMSKQVNTVYFIFHVQI